MKTFLSFLDQRQTPVTPVLHVNLLLLTVLPAMVVLGEVGDVHDANQQWSETDNPNGNWSYHVGELSGQGGRKYDELCVPAAFKQATYWSDAVDNPNTTIFRGHERDPDEYGGHGPFMVRWTAPAGTSGAVEIDASIEQLFEPSRQMRLLIRHNDVEVAQINAVSPSDNNGGNRKRVFLDPKPKIVVLENDRIDFLADGNGPNGTGTATTVRVMSRLTECPPPATYSLTVRTDPPGIPTVNRTGSSEQATGKPVTLSAKVFEDCRDDGSSMVWALDYWDGPVEDPLAPRTTLTSAGQDITVTANFVNIRECSGPPALEAEQFQALSGDWHPQSGLLTQRDASLESAVAVAPISVVYRYRLKARVKLDATDTIGAEAGVVVHVNEDSYVLASIRRNKGGYYAMLTRFGSDYSMGRLPGDMVALPTGSGTDWHTIEVFTDGTHVQAKIDDGVELAFSYPLLEGRPITTGDQNGSLRLASNWGRKTFRMKGRVGFATRTATARFQFLEGESLPADVRVHTPCNPRYDANGRVQARWPYALIMKRYTEWFLDSKNLLTTAGGNPLAHKANLDAVMNETGWPPYFFTWATVVDDMGFDHPTQFPTHNGPPTISGYLQYYLFTGDRRFIKPARQWADWVIDEFSTSEDFAFPYMPKSTYSYIGRPYEAHMLDTLELDKTSYMGLSYLDLYAVTGDKKYLQATRRIADNLLPHQRADGSIPFRIDLKSGEVAGGYTCSQIWHARLFRRLGEFTGRREYGEAERRLLAWILEHPIKTNQWWGFYGDNPDSGGAKSMDQWVALSTAQWLIDHHQSNAAYLPAARRILAYIEEKFFRMGGVHRGVPAIGEQTGWPAILPHHNMRLAETYARLYGASGDEEAKELALRISNSMTQMAMNDGKFHHGLNSGIENRTMLGLNFNLQFSRIMAEIPETAPLDENHLLYTSGYVREINYESDSVSYETLGPTQDVLVVKSRPKQIRVNGMPLPESEKPVVSRTATMPVGWLYEASIHRLILLHEPGRVEIEF